MGINQETEGYKRLQAQCNATNELGHLIQHTQNLNDRLGDNEIMSELVDELKNIMGLLKDAGLPVPNIENI